MTLLTHIAAVGETWQRWTECADRIRREGMSEAALRALVDSKNAHVQALDLATLAAMKAAHGPVLERSLARAGRIPR